MLSYLAVIFILFCHNVQSQFHLYYMDQTTNLGSYYGCLYYKTNDENQYITPEQNFQTHYQIIPYCFRPFPHNDYEIQEGTVLSRSTFKELRNRNVTTNDLLFWSASIDVIEQYDEYLNSLMNVSLEFEMYYNCSLPWFGKFCQYTFNLTTSFRIIVNATFQDKRFLNITDMTCYIDLNCDRGPSPACLDWREICDGKIDCIGNGIDEMNCFELEMNECEEYEFRCHNGLCIPEEFVNEGPHYPDCLDGTDEDRFILIYDIIRTYTFFCPKQPEFWCEETDFNKPSHFFVCGDGQRTDSSILYTPLDWGRDHCTNRRDELMKTSLLSLVEHSNLSYDCWHFLHCTTIHYHELHCNGICEDSDESTCDINLKSKCYADFVIFPQRPVLQGHVLFVYLTNKTISYVDEETSIFPDYVCYDTKRCPFLPNISSLNINGTTCRSTLELNLHQAIDIIHLFQSCLTTVANELDINRSYESLFHCSGTNKYISKHRVLDGVIDCYNGTDETNIDTCQWNDKYRFKCSSENKCISHYAVRNLINDCRDGEDEVPTTQEQITFQIICNGYVHLSSILIDEFNETDETHCDDWPCNNLYTRCDGAWNCPNGEDELNCRPSNCTLDTHECVSPETKQVICLPVHRAGDGIIDCLGSTDERAYCRSVRRTSIISRYKCWNEDFCVHSNVRCKDPLCRYEDLNECSKDVEDVFKRLEDDRKLQRIHYKYFMLEHIDKEELSSKITTSTPPNHLDPTGMTRQPKFGIRRTETCNRGILIYVGLRLTTSCLCPPSYYGDRCQYQSQRVSLTLQFTHICAQECLEVFAIIIILIDQDNSIHSYEQLTYTTTHQCENKYYLYLLYQTRSKDMTNNYNVRIDVYNKRNLTYYASWILPVRFLFLPVNKIAAHLFIPTHPISSSLNCSLSCDHGQCVTYVNTRDNHFCHCDFGWSGRNCTIPLECDCSSDSRCVGQKNNQSICLCSLEKYGGRCRLQSICVNDTCKNGGQCVPDDERVSRNTFICLCPKGFTGRTCEISQSKIHISFHHIAIPRSLHIHLITVRSNANPMRTTILTKIPYDQNSAIIHVSLLYHVIIIQISHEYYLGYVKLNYTSSLPTGIQIKSEDRCLHVKELFDNKTLATYPLIYRVKSYHLFCKTRLQLQCFHDNETFQCLCNEKRYANCFPFDFNTKYTCKGLGNCKNNGECYSDRERCPFSVFCICQDCFYGSKCEYSTKGRGLSLDAILGYHIRPRLAIHRQPLIVKISIALTVIMFIIGLINSILSILTFRTKQRDGSGSRLYLLATSIASLCTTILFTVKFLILILSQMSIITNLTVLRISCISIDSLLRLGPMIVDWLNASVAIDRSLVVTMSTKYNKKKSKRAVRWVIICILIITIGSILHDPIHRALVYDEGEDRRWCLVNYSSSLEIYNSTINIIHFFIPFVINIVAVIVIIIGAARRRSSTRHDQTYRQHLKEQFHEHKHLIISSIVLVLLATPGLIISFVSGCMKSPRNSSLYLAGYFISFIPPSSTFLVFIIPSKLYTKQFYTATKRFRNVIRRPVATH